MSDAPPFIAGYWGKAQAGPDDDPRWHPLAYHSLDVAAVADRILTVMPHRLSRLSELTGAAAASLHRFLVVLVALHDIGKLSLDFQAKSESGPRGKLPLPPAGVRHDAIGFRLLDKPWSVLDRTLARYLADADAWKYFGPALWSAVSGHHGEPATEAGNYWERGFASTKHDVAEFVGGVCALLPPETERLPKLDHCAPILSWHLAGLTNISDWIGSSRTWFPYARPDRSLEQYWADARSRADTALELSGLLPSRCPPHISAGHLLPHISEGALSPLQDAARTCALPAGPVLALVEDVTGAGKTEAALLIAARLMADGRAGGLFFALPTMATANAMYDRLRDSYRRLFEADALPSLALAHGKRALHEGFRSSIVAPPDAASSVQPGREDNPADVTASAACAAWIADDRRKAFLADVGVGTIDQALLGVLPSRFQSLRLWGLAERVLVVDEAHSFDSYLSRELETLLEFHAALGGSAIVLSATLSTEARQRIATAFQRGLGAPAEPVTAVAYPLLTLVGKSGVSSTAVAARPNIARHLAVRRITSEAEAVAHALSMSERGAAVAWIRNAVDDAISAYAALRAEGREPILLHARFAMGDRLAIEAEVQRRLGRKSTPALRKDDGGNGLIILGTQILEQSLDYDVDAMISDLAPVDMIIQRAGRLWRHPWRTGRPIGEDERELLLLSPDPFGEITREWYRALSRQAAAVYPAHGYVWRTARTLLDVDHGGIRTPDGVRRLLAAVYNDDDPQARPVPPGLDRASLDAHGKRAAARSLAAANSLDVRLGYLGNNQLFASDTITPTRLGEKVTVLRLARRDKGHIVPWFPVDECDGSLARAWALSECAVRQTKASGVPPVTGSLAREIAAAKEAWPAWEQDEPLLLLEPARDDPGGNLWHGRVVDKDNREREVLYDDRMGLRISE